MNLARSCAVVKSTTLCAVASGIAWLFPKTSACFVVVLILVDLVLKPDFLRTFVPVVRDCKVKVRAPARMQPGEHYTTELSAEVMGGAAQRNPRAFVRVLTWNVQRGFDLDNVIAELVMLQADVLLLQEVDINCKRSGRVDVAAEIAAAAGLPFIMFAVETCIDDGYHGNAIISRYPLHSSAVHIVPCGRTPAMKHKGHVHPCVGASIQTPQGPLAAWSIHLDSLWAGVTGRVMQFEKLQSALGGLNGLPILGGDLNTMASGHRRFLPMFCNDNLRWGSLGLSESEWWTENVLPRLGWADPSGDSPTLSVLGGLMASDKLDWLLFRQADLADQKVVISQSKTGGDHASDHKYIFCDIILRHDVESENVSR